MTIFYLIFLTVSGRAFVSEDVKSPYLRLAFSLVPAERLEEAVIRLAASIRQSEDVTSHSDYGA